MLIRSLIALQSVELGFRPENVLVAHADLPEARYPDAVNRKAFFEPLLQRVRGLPGVRSAALNVGDLDLAPSGPISISWFEVILLPARKKCRAPNGAWWGPASLRPWASDFSAAASSRTRMPGRTSRRW